MTYDELNAAYDAAMVGSDEPDIMSLYCGICDRNFVADDPLCEHIEEAIRRFHPA